MKTNEIAIILLAAGHGERCNGILPKQFANINGVSLWHIAYEWLRAALPDAMVIIVGLGAHQHLWDLRELEGAFEWVEGGATRSDSVKAGLAALAPYQPQYVLVHDAARPFVSAKVVTDLLEALRGGGLAAIPAIPTVDTVKRVASMKVLETMERSQLWNVQTPQAFDYKTLLELHQATNVATTDDAALFEQAGIEVAVVQGAKQLFKVTTIEDLALAKYYYGSNQKMSYETISAMGFDVHKLEDLSKDAPQFIRLGGIDLEHHQRLSGHSDADVVLHAITDAVLGLVSAGDIGQHFPPSNADFQGADSAIFLRHAMQILCGRGGELLHIDATIICEAPKIAPHREAMRERIADILQVDLRRISIKATTTEGLGFAGRKEGIAAQAIATARMFY